MGAKLAAQIAGYLLQQSTPWQAQGEWASLMIRWAVLADLRAAQRYLQTRPNWEQIRSLPEAEIRQKLFYALADRLFDTFQTPERADPGIRIAPAAADPRNLARQLAALPIGAAMDTLQRAGVLYGWSADEAMLRAESRRQSPSRQDLADMIFGLFGRAYEDHIVRAWTEDVLQAFRN